MLEREVGVGLLRRRAGESLITALVNTAEEIPAEVENSA